MEGREQVIDDRLARLERENRQLRAKLGALADVERRSTIYPSRTAIGCFSLLVVTTLIFLSTTLYAPWLEVRTERREVLYWHEHVKDLYSRFAGFDYLLSAEKWKEKDRKGFDFAVHGWEKYDHFEVTVYRVFWQMLIGEWLLLGIGGMGIAFALRRRRRRIREASKPKGLPDRMDVRSK
jgi:hypothetical protein